MMRDGATQNATREDLVDLIPASSSSTGYEFEAPNSVGAMIVYVLLGLTSFVIICLFRFVPKKLWTHLDVFSMEHYIKQGESPVKRRTPLGFSFTIAFLPIAIMITIGLVVSNRPIETQSLQAANSQPALTGQLSVQLTLPLNKAQNASTCRFVTMTTAGAPVCGKTATFDPDTCTFTGTSCNLGLDTTFTFAIPWNQRWVQWGVTAETAIRGKGTTISGQVICATPDRLLSGTKDSPIAIEIQAMASYRNDTTSDESGDTTTGYNLYPRAHAPPNTRRILSNETTLVDDALPITANWTLEITLRRSPLLHMVNISRPLSLFPLLSLCLSTVLSFLGVWRVFFKSTETITWQATTLWNKQQAKKARVRTGIGATVGGNGGGGVGSGTAENKSDCDPVEVGLELQAAVRVRTASTEVFERLPSMTNPVYGHREISDRERSPSMYGQHSNVRIAKLEERAEEAEKRAGEAKIEAKMQAVEAAQQQAQLVAQMLELEQRLERAVAGKEV
jgi:hypothetical protein